jgi:aryl-alcohol dehydrogenase-like predicted oxidoreductase
VLDAAARHGIGVIARVVDYGGLLWDDVRPGHAFAPRDHRLFRPPGWVEAAMPTLEAMRPVAERHGLTLLQLACAWTLSHPAVTTAVPTLIQEPGPGARPVEAKRAELAATPARSPLSAQEVAELRALGDNTGSMLLKGATPDHEGPPLPDRWAVDEELGALAARWGITPARQLVKST